MNRKMLNREVLNSDIQSMQISKWEHVSNNILDRENLSWGTMEIYELTNL